jgi:hypothetical protein
VLDLNPAIWGAIAGTGTCIRFVIGYVLRQGPSTTRVDAFAPFDEAQGRLQRTRRKGVDPLRSG